MPNYILLQNVSDFPARINTAKNNNVIVAIILLSAYF